MDLTHGYSFALDLTHGLFKYCQVYVVLGFEGMRFVHWARRASFGLCQALKKKIGQNVWFLGFMVMVYIVTQFGNEIVNIYGII